jgi:hypothetical protein
VSIEDQGSLLEDMPEEHLNEEETKEAEAELEREINPVRLPPPAPAPPPASAAARSPMPYRSFDGDKGGEEAFARDMQRLDGNPAALRRVVEVRRRAPFHDADAIAMAQPLPWPRPYPVGLSTALFSPLHAPPLP